MFDQHDIFICNLIRDTARKLDILRRLEIDQIILYDQLRNLIPRERNHTVSDNTSVPCHGNITCPRANIDKRDI